MEKLLVLWIDDMTKRHLPLTESLIRYKAKSLFDELSGEEDGSNDFTATGSGAQPLRGIETVLQPYYILLSEKKKTKQTFFYRF
jgi:hypothetical protein